MKASLIEERPTTDFRFADALSAEIAAIITAALQDEIVDDELILTLAFYLQCGLLKTLMAADAEIIAVLKPCVMLTGPAGEINNELSSSRFEVLPQPTPGEIEANDNFLIDRVTVSCKFEKNKETLIAIAEGTDLNSWQSEQPAWMAQWMEVCGRYLQKGHIVKEIYELFYKKIVAQLDLQPAMEDLLIHFTRRVFGLLNKPDMVIMGAQKCGTSTLHSTLVNHPGVNGPIKPETGQRMKEVNFIGHRTAWKNGIDYYFSHFTGTKGLFLDSSPNYLCTPFCYKRMRLLLPDAKLIICIRNPVIRAYSQYNHYRQVLPYSANWDWKQDLDFLTNVKLELDDIEVQLKQGPNYFDQKPTFPGLILRGVYISQIKQLLHYYDRSQIYITVTDWWPQNYESELNKIQTFLGLEKETLPPRIANKREYTVEPFDEEAKRLLTEFYKPYNQELFEFLGYEIPEWNRLLNI